MSLRSPLVQLARSTSSESLPGEYVELTARRLGLTVGAAGALHVLYVVLYATVWSIESNVVGMIAGYAGVFVSAAVSFYVLQGPRTARQVTSVGIVYELFLSLSMALSESWATASRYDALSPQVSWGTVVIMLFPFLIPASPRVVITAAFAAASSTPLAMALRFAMLDRGWPDAGVIASYVLPPYLCALLVVVPTSTLYRLGTAVQRARRLGNYELIERIGQGGMGEVWRANHRLLARPAAVKLIKPEMIGAIDPKSREAVIRRFEKEAQTTASLDSIHTVELFDFGVSAEGVLFYVMELLHGVDLQALVERFGPLPSERIIHMLIQACDSLADAHERGLIHRDIKPANMFIARKAATYDFLKVLDFGLVKRWREPAPEILETLQSQPIASLQTNLGQIVGTPAFLAPEAALGEQAADGRADLYALGCVAYWMSTGTLVFDEPGALAVTVAHVTKEPVAPSARTSLPIHPDLERIILQCLQKDRDQRPQSADALRESLASIQLEQPWTRERARAWWIEHLPLTAATQ